MDALILMCSGSLLADTVTIVARKEKMKELKNADHGDKKQEKGKSFFTNEFADEIRKVGLKTINVDALYKNIQKSLEPPSKMKGEENNELRDDDMEGPPRAEVFSEKKLYQIDFNLEEIKRKYLFPFNISKEKSKFVARAAG
jgi:hypothetical protein